METAIAKISSKGQIVIPSHMRKDIKVGEEFLLIKDQNRIILKKISQVTDKLKEDLRFARHVEKAWIDHNQGKFTKKNAADFLEEIDQC